MGKIPVFVGLDYHQAKVQVCVMDQAGKVLANKPVENDINAIVQVVNKHGIVKRAAIEACGGAANLAEKLIQKEKWSINLAHPGYVKRMKKSPDKTDFSDAKMLADLQRVGYLPKVWLAPQYIRDLRQVVRYRQQLANERRAIKLRVSGLLREQRIPKPDCNAWTMKWRNWLKNDAPLNKHNRWIMTRHLERFDELRVKIAESEKYLKEFVADDSQVSKLMDQPGIGLITAVTLRAEIGQFDRFCSGKQLSRFCGLSPCNASSGQRQADAGIIKAGNRALRSVLIEAAHRLARHDCRWKQFAQSMRQRGKHGNVTAVAIANRFIRQLWHRMQPSPQTA